MNAFTRNSRLSPHPWRIQCDRRGLIYDLEDRRVATVPKAGEIPHTSRVANMRVIERAPELLDRLIASTLMLQMAGTQPHPETLELLNYCRPGQPPILPPADESDDA